MAYDSRFRFNLRSMFALVSVAAVVAATIGWYGRRPSFEVIGDLNRGDIAAIQTAVESSVFMVDKRIVSMTTIGGDRVRVRTADQPFGVNWLVCKVTGIWIVKGIESFVIERDPNDLNWAPEQ